MATLLAQQANVSGVAITYAAASGGGDKFGPSPRRHFRVKNGSGGAITVTIVVPGTTKYALAQPDITASVGAGAEYCFGPFPDDLGDPADNGLISVTYSGVTSLTVAVVDV